MEAKHGVKIQKRFGYTGGADTEGHPYIRIDTHPVPNAPKLKT